MQSETLFLGEFHHIEKDGEYNCIEDNTEIIKKLIETQLKLLKIIITKNISLYEYNELAKISARICKKLEFYKDIRCLYLNRYKEEFSEIIDDLESTQSDIDLLSIRYEIGEIGNEEYQTKISAYYWDVDQLHKKKDRLEKNLTLLQSLSNIIEPEYSSMLNSVYDDNYRIINYLEVDDETRQILKKNIDSIAELIEIKPFPV